MHTALNPYTAGLAVAGAGILTVGLVTAPPRVDAVVSHREVHALQLAATTSSEIGTAFVHTAASLTATAKPTGTTQQAAATSPSTRSVGSTAAAATSTTPAAIVTGITNYVTGIVTGITGIVADVGVGASLLVIFVPAWFVLSPLTFFLTGLGTAVLGCQINSCFTNAAENFFIIPFAPAAIAFQQAYQQVTYLLQQIVAPLTGAAAAATTRTAAAASSSTDTTAAVADTRTRASAIARVNAAPRVKLRSVTTKAAVDTPDALEAVDTKREPLAAATADAGSLTQVVKASKTGPRAQAHRAADRGGKHRKN